MQAIQVKYLSATDTKPSRLKAFCKAGSVTVLFNHDNEEQGYIDAARQLAEKLGWFDFYYGGTLPNNDKVFVMHDDKFEFTAYLKLKN